MRSADIFRYDKIRLHLTERTFIFRKILQQKTPDHKNFLRLLGFKFFKAVNMLFGHFKSCDRFFENQSAILLFNGFYLIFIRIFTGIFKVEPQFCMFLCEMLVIKLASDCRVII